MMKGFFRMGLKAIILVFMFAIAVFPIISGTLGNEITSGKDQDLAQATKVDEFPEEYLYNSDKSKIDRELGAGESHALGLEESSRATQPEKEISFPNEMETIENPNGEDILLLSCKPAMSSKAKNSFLNYILHGKFSPQILGFCEPCHEEGDFDEMLDIPDGTEKTSVDNSDGKHTSWSNLSGQKSSQRNRQLGLEEYRKGIVEQEENSSIFTGSSNEKLQTQSNRRKGTDGPEYNYAAAAHGAKLVDSNKDSTGAKHVLDEDRDKYLRNPCSSSSKFLVIELSDVLKRIESIVLINYEFYSSGVKGFNVSVSRLYPATDWILLASFSANNTRVPQKFDFPDGYNGPLIQYVKLDLISHHGSEFYCTLSSVRIHGVDELATLKEEIEALRLEPSIDNANAEMPNRKASEGEGSDLTGGGTAAVKERSSYDRKGIRSKGNDSSMGRSAQNTSVSIGDGLNGSENGTSKKLSEGSNETVSELSGNNENVSISQKNQAPEFQKPAVQGSSVIHGSKELKDREASSRNTNEGQPGNRDFVLTHLVTKIKLLEKNQSILERYIEEAIKSQQESLVDMDNDFGLLNSELRNLSSVAAELSNNISDMEKKHQREISDLRALLLEKEVRWMSEIADQEKRGRVLGSRHGSFILLLSILSVCGFLLALFTVWKMQAMNERLLQCLQNNS